MTYQQLHATASHVAHQSQGKTSKTCKKRKDGVLRKAPQAPRRFKSSYILFFMAKQNEIKRTLPPGSSVGDVSKKSSQMWKALPANERAYWDGCAEQDKQRYLREKSEYTGPWQVPYKRVKKNPLAPKRPMSSFLFFSKERRKTIKAKYPTMKNTEISSMLGEQWRNATEEERRPHIETEMRERTKYKAALDAFKRTELARKQQEQEAAETVRAVNQQIRRSLSPPKESPPSHQVGPQQAINNNVFYYHQHYNNMYMPIAPVSCSPVHRSAAPSVQPPSANIHNTQQGQQSLVTGVLETRNGSNSYQTDIMGTELLDYDHPFTFDQDPFATESCL